MWASDIPYGEPLAALNLFARAARKSGARDDTLHGMLSGTARGLLDGRRPDRRSAPLGGTEYHASYARMRASFYLASATPLLWMGMPESVGFLGLAEAALHEEGLDEQADLVRCTAALWAEWVTTIVPGAPPDLIGRGRVFRLLNAAQADTVLG